MKRALRVDKMTLAALEAVLRLYANPQRLRKELPTLRWLTRPLADIEAQAGRMLPHIAAALGNHGQVTIVACSSQIGSGSLPVDTLPSAAIAVSGGENSKRSFANKIEMAFRALPVPVIGRIKDGAYLMDLRCLDDEAEFVAQLGQLKIVKT